MVLHEMRPLRRNVLLHRRHVTWQAGTETLLLHLVLVCFRHAHFTSACSRILAALETLRIDNVYIWERMSICTR